MKRFIISCCIFALCICTALLSSFLLSRQTKELSSALGDALEAAETGDNLLTEKTEYVLKTWEKTNEIMHVFIIHGDMAEVEASVLSLDDYLRENNTTLYREACVRGINQLKNISNANRPTWGNIL